MSSTTATVSAPTSTPTVGCGAELYNIPTQDAAVGITSGGNHTDIMGACCGSADVISYYDNCGLYCLAAGQSVNDLIKCLFDHGAPNSDVFYRGNVSATATATDVPLPTSAGASVVVTHDGGSNPTQSGGDGDSTSSPTNTPNAAAGIRPEFTGLSTLGLTIGALLFSATAFGAFQL
ncbi:uncharacterized protein F4822DRAFT_416394 [Hypoxylon trugodes]|uniref:uncharacterized protein n=1 Tax=Hypoxylon trugodes TaxID=326681 RepID=UPI00218FD9BE|nr:uncharacterized protein F4822DRAFT_416394 [Hypoxylon trugodes]KAI1384832.1 hypothetical protein F4822DRAFT_416394 [Hypoxylon trugodes]